MQLSRIKWLDTLKGIAIIMVVLGHALKTGDVRDVLYSFHVPLFFFCSGVTANEDLSLKRICADIKKLLIPYYIFGILSIAIYAVLGGGASSSLGMGETTSVYENLKSLVYCSSNLPFNAPLWFLPSLLITKIYYKILFHTTKGHKILLFSMAVIGCVVGFGCSNTISFTLPCSFELTLKLFPFFLIGRIFSKALIEIGEIKCRKYNLLMMAIIFLVITSVLAVVAPSINYTNNQFPIPILFYVVASTGCVGAYFISVSFQNSRLLVYLGRKTLPILLMHKFPIVFFQIIPPFSIILKEPNTIIGLLIAICASVVAIVASIIAGVVIENCCPVFMGKKFDRIIK